MPALDSLADTSLAVALVLTSHEAYERANRAVGDRPLRLAAHAALETYSVLTRLPGDARLTARDAARLIRVRFSTPVLLPRASSVALIDELARLGIVGGAVYDALIAATARAVGGVLLTRDRRAAATYSLLQVQVEIVG